MGITYKGREVRKNFALLDKIMRQMIFLDIISFHTISTVAPPDDKSLYLSNGINLKLTEYKYSFSSCSNFLNNLILIQIFKSHLPTFTITYQTIIYIDQLSDVSTTIDLIFNYLTMNCNWLSCLFFNPIRMQISRLTDPMAFIQNRTGS